MKKFQQEYPQVAIEEYEKSIKAWLAKKLQRRHQEYALTDNSASLRITSSQI